MKSERREFQAEDLPRASTLRKEGAWPMWGAAKGQTAEQKGRGRVMGRIQSRRSSARGEWALWTKQWQLSVTENKGVKPKLYGL